MATVTLGKQTPPAQERQNEFETLVHTQKVLKVRMWSDIPTPPLGLTSDLMSGRPKRHINIRTEGRGKRIIENKVPLSLQGAAYRQERKRST